MNLEQQRSQLIQVVLADHEILSHLVAKCQRLFEGQLLRASPADVAEIQDWLGQKMVRHFAYEEERLFPFLWGNLPAAEFAQRIGRLRVEHQQLLAEGQRLRELLSAADPAMHTVETWDQMLDFLNGLEQHAAEEDELLQPFLDRRRDGLEMDDRT